MTFTQAKEKLLIWLMSAMVGIGLAFLGVLTKRLDRIESALQKSIENDGIRTEQIFQIRNDVMDIKGRVLFLEHLFIKPEPVTLKTEER